MGIIIRGSSGQKYSFEGPWDDTNQLEDRSGVYFISCFKNNKHVPIDVGESKHVKTRIETHERKECWDKECQETLLVSVHYTPNKQQATRVEFEQDIRSYYFFLCGDK